MRSRRLSGIVAMACIVATWVGALLFWRTGGRVPATGEIVGGLFVLPALGLAAAWLASRWRQRAEAGTGPSPSSAACAGKDRDSPDAEEKNRRLRPVIAAAALRTAHGRHPGEVSAVLGSAQALLPLDPHLKNADGFPVISGRVPSLDSGDSLLSMAAWIAERHPERPPCLPEHIRAMALLREVAAEIADGTAKHADLATDRSAMETLRSTLAVPALRLVVLLPNDLASLAVAATALVVEVFATAGWPPEKIEVVASEAVGEREPFAVVDLLFPAMGGEKPAALVVLLSTASSIGETTVREWERTTRLFSGNGDRGQFPAEAAAAVLLTSSEQAALLPDGVPARLHRAALGRRERSADASARIDAGLSIALCRQALAFAGVDGDRVCRLIADADRRASRSGELMQAADAVVPDLCSDSVISIEANCGALGPAAALTMLVLAREAVLGSGKAALCLSNRGSLFRSAVVLSAVDETTAFSASDGGDMPAF